MSFCSLSPLITIRPFLPNRVNIANISALFPDQVAWGRCVVLYHLMYFFHFYPLIFFTSICLNHSFLVVRIILFFLLLFSIAGITWMLSPQFNPEQCFALRGIMWSGSHFIDVWSLRSLHNISASSRTNSSHSVWVVARAIASIRAYRMRSCSALPSGVVS